MQTGPAMPGPFALVRCGFGMGVELRSGRFNCSRSGEAPEGQEALRTAGLETGATPD